MEPLYAKLYDKYTKLKAKKFGEMERSSRDQEEKFINFMAASEELIQHLKDENDSLRAKLDGFISSTRPSVDDQGLEYQNLLMEEIHKNKQLSEEIEKLHELQNKGVGPNREHVDGEEEQLNYPVAPLNGSDVSNGPTTRSRQKRTRPPEIDAESIPKRPDNRGRTAVQESSRNIFCKETTSPGVPEEDKQPQCCRRPSGEMGDGADDKFTGHCLFQALIEYTLGMQFSVVTQVAGICISALHESSGYSFSLTWSNKEAPGEVEMMYRVQSLGTYERVAPPWMREAIKFSTSMCPVFFNRIARFIGVHH